MILRGRAQEGKASANAFQREKSRRLSVLLAGAVSWSGDSLLAVVVGVEGEAAAGVSMHETEPFTTQSRAMIPSGRGADRLCARVSGVCRNVTRPDPESRQYTKFPAGLANVAWK